MIGGVGRGSEGDATIGTTGLVRRMEEDWPGPKYESRPRVAEECLSAGDFSIEDSEGKEVEEVILGEAIAGGGGILKVKSDSGTCWAA